MSRFVGDEVVEADGFDQWVVHELHEPDHPIIPAVAARCTASSAVSMSVIRAIMVAATVSRQRPRAASSARPAPNPLDNITGTRAAVQWSFWLNCRATAWRHRAVVSIAVPQKVGTRVAQDHRGRLGPDFAESRLGHGSPPWRRSRQTDHILRAAYPAATRSAHESPGIARPNGRLRRS